MLNVRLLRQKGLKSEHLRIYMEHLSISDLQDAASKTLDKDQFLKNEEDVAMP